MGHYASLLRNAHLRGHMTFGRTCVFGTKSQTVDFVCLFLGEVKCVSSHGGLWLFCLVEQFIFYKCFENIRGQAPHIQDLGTKRIKLMKTVSYGVSFLIAGFLHLMSFSFTELWFWSTDMFVVCGHGFNVLLTANRWSEDIHVFVLCWQRAVQGRHELLFGFVNWYILFVCLMGLLQFSGESVCLVYVFTWSLNGHLTVLQVHVLGSAKCPFLVRCFMFERPLEPQGFPLLIQLEVDIAYWGLRNKPKRTMHWQILCHTCMMKGVLSLWNRKCCDTSFKVSSLNIVNMLQQDLGYDWKYSLTHLRLFSLQSEKERECGDWRGVGGGGGGRGWEGGLGGGRERERERERECISEVKRERERERERESISVRWGGWEDLAQSDWKSSRVCTHHMLIFKTFRLGSLSMDWLIRGVYY